MNIQEAKKIDRKEENAKQRSKALAQIVYDRIKDQYDEKLSVDGGAIRYDVEHYYSDYVMGSSKRRKTHGYGYTGKLSLGFAHDKKMRENKVNIFDKIDEIVEHTKDSIDKLKRESKMKKERNARRQREDEIKEILEDNGYKDYYYNQKDYDHVLKVDKGGRYSAGITIEDHRFDLDEDTDMDELIEKLDKVDEAMKELKDFLED